MTNVNGDDGPWGYSMTFYKMLHGPLHPGPELDAMNRVMAERVMEAVDGVRAPKTVRLFEFVRREITRATTDSVYGPKNPFKDPEISEAFW